ncbi:MAG: hypothetical protein E7Z65_05890 [Thermoplasmata archaeon]|jgi:hypothetical protein|nr:hypothetical protein [Thermoplasmata archaeon]
MVNACPAESDPRPKVADFVSNKDSKALAGLVVEGTESLVGVVKDEIQRQEPGSNIIVVDRDLLADEDITFARDLSAFIDRKLAEGRKVNLIIVGDIPIVGWNGILDKYKGAEMQVYYVAAACRQVPLCTKIDL